MDSAENQSDQRHINKEDDDACLYAMHLPHSFVLISVLNAAVELKLFDIIAQASPDACMSPSEIASQLPTRNPHAAALLDRMLRLLASYSLLTCSVQTSEDGKVQRLYGLSPAGKFYVQTGEGCSLAPMTLFACKRMKAEIWDHLKDVILDEGNLSEMVYRKSAFHSMDADPALNKLFNNAMAENSAIATTKVLEAYKGFEGVSLLVDVGGGTGATLNMILSKYPSIKGINFDLPRVIKNAPSYTGIEHVEGDMFVDIPKGDAIILKTICHDWNDEYCIKLLKNCNKALAQNGKVIVIDYIMPEAPEANIDSKFLSIIDNVLGFSLGGRERTVDEFMALSKSSGFSDFQVICRAYNVLGVMEFIK